MSTAVPDQIIAPFGGTVYLILVQVVSRGLTFLANQILLRHISPTTFGAATQLELFALSVLYFSRESIRIAIQRQPPDGVKASDSSAAKTAAADIDRMREGTQAVVNVSYLTIVLGLILVHGLSAFYTQVASRDILELPFFGLSLRLTKVACLLELLTEPCFSIIQKRSLYRLRASVETAAVVVKALIACGITIWAARGRQTFGALPFAIGQIAHATVLVLGYFIVIVPISWKDGFSLLLVKVPHREMGRYWLKAISLPLLYLCGSFYLQSVVKYTLSQGDSMALAVLSSLEDQGVYALVSNYGSLIARLLFQPIEESYRSMFGKLLHMSNTNHPKASNMAQAKAQLCDIFRAYTILSILACSVGPSTIPPLLKVVIGSKWSSPNMYALFSSYCFYIPFLAFNGITEAFVSATATHSDLRRQAVWMSACSAAFVASAYLLLKVGGYGASGIVWANTINMALRIIWSLSYIKEYFCQHHSDLRTAEAFPNLHTLVGGIVAWLIMFGASAFLGTNPQDVLKVFGTGVICSISIIYLERDYLVHLYARYWPSA